MSPARRTLVVGTTWDYIELIHQRHPGRALFLTEPNERQASRLAPPPSGSEILCDFKDRQGVLHTLGMRIRSRSFRPSGIAAFDCDSLMWAAGLARDLHLPFPAPDSVALCRDKVLSKHAWQKSGLKCPRAEEVFTLDQAKEFLHGLGRPIVLKPLSGTGSSGVFKCATPQDVERCFPPALACARKFNSHAMSLAAEEALAGQEYSCDFALENGRVTILRVALKHPVPHGRFGATLAYLVRPGMPLAADNLALENDLLTALGSLGMERALGMADFFWQDDRPCFLEIAPRPGGDCLPWVVLAASGMDLIKATLDFSEGLSPSVVPASEWQPMVGLMLYASPGGGITASLDRLAGYDSRIREINLFEQVPPLPGGAGFSPGQGDLRRLGHLIFSPHDPSNFGEEALALHRDLCADLQLVA